MCVALTHRICPGVQELHKTILLYWTDVLLFYKTCRYLWDRLPLIEKIGWIYLFTNTLCLVTILELLLLW